ncbi:hypothetical protein M1D49_00360 [Bacillus sp. PK3-056]|uniref:hypothetical protein n=1 Tax=Niallia circulans TaxID=1397 RepID=UPI000F44721C|nr:hypothetical protein [Niallia circulans]AYV72916.1 hypothetical protein C2H98_15970 [Niallia circulans]
MKKIHMNTPKDEAECILRQSTKKDIEKFHKLGLPVRTVDELGVYDLYPDGRKEYVKLYKKGNKDIE